MCANDGVAPRTRLREEAGRAGDGGVGNQGARAERKEEARREVTRGGAASLEVLRE